METDPSLELVSRLLRHAKQSKPEGVHYFCDASILAGAGIPSVVFGPGDIAQAHTRDEWINIGSLDRSRRILAGFLGSLDN